MISSEEDKEIVKNASGLYVGQLTDDEIDSLNRCIKDGFAYKSYDDISGLLGIAKVRLIE